MKIPAHTGFILAHVGGAIGLFMGFVSGPDLMGPMIGAVMGLALGWLVEVVLFVAAGRLSKRHDMAPTRRR